MPDSYGLRLPPEWTELPIDAAGFDRRVAEVRDEARKQSGWTRTADRRIEALMHQLRTAITSARVTFVATLLGIAEDLADDAAASSDDILAAGCVISTMTRADLDTDAPLAASVLLAAYSADRDSPSDVVNLEPAKIVRLRDSGEAVRLVRTLNAGAVAGQSISVFAETYLIPIADGEGVCVLQFSTPNLEDATAFSELFVAIAGTLRIFYEDTPTIGEAATA